MVNAFEHPPLCVLLWNFLYEYYPKITMNECHWEQYFLFIYLWHFYFCLCSAILKLSFIGKEKIRDPYIFSSYFTVFSVPILQFSTVLIFPCFLWRRIVFFFVDSMQVLLLLLDFLSHSEYTNYQDYQLKVQ